MAEVLHATYLKSFIDLTEDLRVLVVGSPDEQVDVARLFIQEFEYRCTEFSAVRQALRSLEPDMVLSPILGQNFDCFDLANLLTAERFQGQYRGVAERLPQPGVVRSEVRSLFPEVDFDVLMIRTGMRPRLS